MGKRMYDGAGFRGPGGTPSMFLMDPDHNPEWILGVLRDFVIKDLVRRTDEATMPSGGTK
jgi:hypothetical protein